MVPKWDRKKFPFAFLYSAHSPIPLPRKAAFLFISLCFCIDGYAQLWNQDGFLLLDRKTLMALTFSFIRLLKLLWLCCSAKAFDEVTCSIGLMLWLMFHQNQQPVALPRTCLCFYPTSLIILSGTSCSHTILIPDMSFLPALPRRAIFSTLDPYLHGWKVLL